MCRLWLNHVVILLFYKDGRQTVLQIQARTSRVIYNLHIIFKQNHINRKNDYHNRPNITAFNNGKKQVFLIDVTVPTPIWKRNTNKNKGNENIWRKYRRTVKNEIYPYYLGNRSYVQINKGITKNIIIRNNSNETYSKEIKSCNM